MLTSCQNVTYDCLSPGHTGSPLPADLAENQVDWEHSRRCLRHFRQDADFVTPGAVCTMA